MIDTCRLHSDYENFAEKFLGVDYEDFVNMQYGFDGDEEEEVEIEYGYSLNF